MKYKVLVTEIHEDIVIVEADNEEEAEALAIELSSCQFTCLDNVEILEIIQ